MEIPLKATEAKRPGIRHSLRAFLLMVGGVLMAPPVVAGTDSPLAPISLPATDIDKLVGASVTFTGGAGTGATWDFGDGSPVVIAQTTTHAFSTPGPHTVTYTVKIRNRYYVPDNPEGDPPYFIYTSTRVVTTWLPVSISKLTANQSTGPISVRALTPVVLEWATANATTLTMAGNGDLGSVLGQTSKTDTPASATTYTLTASNPASSASLSVNVSTYVVGVSVNPATASLNQGQVQSLTATITQSSQNVTWTTNATANQGTLSGTSGSTVSFQGKAAGTYSVVARSIEDPSKSATATITVAKVAVSPITPANPNIDAGLELAFSSNVTGALDSGLTWKINEVNAPVSIDPNGRFHATQAGTWTVTATSTADPTQLATTQVVVQPVVTGVALYPTEKSMEAGKPFAFQATVSGLGGGSTAVVWSCSAGSIDSNGTFTAPLQSGDVTVTATSVQDKTKSRSAIVHVQTWVLRLKKNVLYLGSKELAEVDATGKTWVTFVDHLGSPRLIWDGTATSNGVPDDKHLIEQKFMPFGESLNPTGAPMFAKGFTNHEQTDPSGLIYMQARFYAPWFGRFLSPDPARDQHFEETQSWNIYSYVENSPIMHFDPNGEELVAIQLANAKSVSVNSGTRGHVIVVDSSMVPRVAALIANAEANGTRLVITSSFRTNEEQSGLNSSNAVTPAAAGSSPHNAGLALDGTDGKSKSLPSDVVDKAEDLGMRWGGNFKKADDVHVDGATNNAQKAQLTKENQQQWKTGTIQGMTLDAKTGKLVPTNISNSAMKRNTGQTGAAGSVPSAASTASKPGWISRAVDWVKKKLS